MRIVLLSSGGDGQQNDVQMLDQLLREWNLRNGGKAVTSIDRLDPVTFLNPTRPPQCVDLQIHIETPCRAAMPWARCNIVLVNPEWWPIIAWNWVLALPSQGGADIFLFRSAHGRSLFPDIEDARAHVLPWRAPVTVGPSTSERRRTCLFLVGRSVPKHTAAKEVLPHWKAAWPPLTVVTTEARIAELRPLVPSDVIVQFRAMYETNERELRNAAQQAAGYHILASAGEGYGYGFAEAAATGALPLWYGLPVYDSLWRETLGTVGRIAVAQTAASVYRDGRYCAESPAAICSAADTLFSLSAVDARRLRGALVAHIDRGALRSAWTDVMRRVRGAVSRAAVQTLPPAPLMPARLPTVAVVTLTRNRRRWFANMVRNILMAGYPRERLAWVIVDDGDEGQRIEEEVQRFQTSHSEVRVVYLQTGDAAMTFGEKRNRGVAAAPADCSIILMMDDDDHYPAGSISRRVAWMSALDVDCVYCSTLPMYHCGTYTSAYNTPPLDLAPEERVSEATLCFHRTFWDARGFPGDADSAEGTGFLSGRLERTAEIHPAGSIVSFLHGANATSRRIPATAEPNGCHYGFDDDYFLYLSNLATDSL